MTESRSGRNVRVPRPVWGCDGYPHRDGAAPGCCLRHPTATGCRRGRHLRCAGAEFVAIDRYPDDRPRDVRAGRPDHSARTGAARWGAGSFPRPSIGGAVWAPRYRGAGGAR